jgi:hypothetical protein
MARMEEAKDAVIDELRNLDVTPYRPVDLLNVGPPLVGRGFTQSEILEALEALIDDKVIGLLPGNRVHTIEN